jgi:tetratricopeptide (TPR) repeat protein
MAMRLSNRITALTILGLMFYLVGVATACHELTARDRTFWQEMYNKPKSFLFAFTPISISSGPEKARVLNEKGIQAFVKGIYPEAKKFFLQAADINSDEAAVYHNLALISYTRVKLDQAQLYWVKSSKLDPKNPRYHYHAATAFGHDGKIDKAITEYEHTLQITGGSPELFNKVGQLHEFSNRHSQAEKFFKQALAINPYYKQSLQNLARLYVSTGKYRKSEAVYLKMLDIDGDDVEIYISLGKIYSQLGEDQLAVKLFRKAVKKRLDYPYPRFLLADALKKAGDGEKAATMLKLAQTIQRDNYIGCIIDPTADTNVPTIQTKNLRVIPQ